MKNRKSILRLFIPILLFVTTLFALIATQQNIPIHADVTMLSVTDIPRSESELDALVHRLWNDSNPSAIGSKKYLQEQVEKLVNTKGNTGWLYDLAYYTNHFTYYALKRQDIKIASDLADIYLLTLSSLTQHKDNWMAWVRQRGENNKLQENGLESSEPIATASLLAEAISSMPNKEDNNSINTYKEEYWPVIVNHLDRWLRAENVYEFTNAAWHYSQCVDKNTSSAYSNATREARYTNYYELLRDKYTVPPRDGAPQYCTFMRDD